jgi:hypothetical protein
MSVIQLIKPEVTKKYDDLRARKEKGTLELVMSARRRRAH